MYVIMSGWGEEVLGTPIGRTFDRENYNFRHDLFWTTRKEEYLIFNCMHDAAFILENLSCTYFICNLLRQKLVKYNGAKKKVEKLYDIP